MKFRNGRFRQYKYTQYSLVQTTLTYILGTKGPSIHTRQVVLKCKETSLLPYSHPFASNWWLVMNSAKYSITCLDFCFVSLGISITRVIYQVVFSSALGISASAENYTCRSQISVQDERSFFNEFTISIHTSRAT